MDVFDTCDTCKRYYVTRDRSVLPDYDKDYVPRSWADIGRAYICLLYTSPSPRD